MFKRLRSSCFTFYYFIDLYKSNKMKDVAILSMSYVCYLLSHFELKYK